MTPKKSGTDSPGESSFPSVFPKICRESDVSIIPIVRKLPAVADQSEMPDESECLASPLTETDAAASFPGCPPPSPPVIYVVCDIFEGAEVPVAIACKLFYVECALVRAIFTSLPRFSTISCLRIHDCCISRDMVAVLATFLSDNAGASIVDLSLDGNEAIAEAVPLLLRTGLKYLSLRRCGLDDYAVKLISEELSFTSVSERKLLVLNLNMNAIGDEGSLALSSALRTNRTLLSLSLCGNRITDIGAGYITQVLGKFPLTHEEVMCRRRRTFDRIFLKKSLTDKLLEEWKQKNEGAESQLRLKTSERIPGMAKSIETAGKRSSVSSRDKKRISLTKIASGEKLRGRKRDGESKCNTSAGPSPSELKDIMQQVENEVTVDKHPFASEVTASDGELWCEGCWKLKSLNLSYNGLTEVSVSKFVEVVNYQNRTFGSSPDRGLLRLIVQAGNSIPENSCLMDQLKCAMRERHRKSGNGRDGSLGILHFSEALPPNAKA